MPLQTVELIQNGFEEDGITPKMEPRFLKNHHVNGLTILNDQGGLIQHGYGDVNDNTLGVQRVIDTLTYIRATVVKQVFYEVNLMDYGTIEYGEGAFMQSLLQLKEYSTADDFEAGRCRQACAQSVAHQRVIVDEEQADGGVGHAFTHAALYRLPHRSPRSGGIAGCVDP